MLCGQIEEFLSAQPDGMYSNRWALKIRRYRRTRCTVLGLQYELGCDKVIGYWFISWHAHAE